MIVGTGEVPHIFSPSKREELPPLPEIGSDRPYNEIAYIVRRIEVTVYLEDTSLYRKSKRQNNVANLRPWFCSLYLAKVTVGFSVSIGDRSSCFHEALTISLTHS